MSSIDKYVEREAQQLDPRISVRHEGGNIVGRINGDLVFSIQDRYGFLNSYESSIISASTQRYHQQEQMERERMRIQAQNELKIAVKAKINSLNAGKMTAQKTTDNFIREIVALSQKTANGLGDLSAYTQKLSSLRNLISQSGKDAEATYTQKINLLTSIGGTARNDETIASYQSRLNRVNEVNTEIVYDISNTARQQLSKLKEDIDEIQRRSAKIRQKVSQLGKLGISFRTNVIKINSVLDIDRLEKELDARIAEIENIKLDQMARDRLSSINEIELTLNSQESRSNHVFNDYTITSYEDEISNESRKVRSAYNSLKTTCETSFSTCDADEIAKVIACLDEIDALKPTDEKTYRLLKSFMEKYTTYLTEDKKHLHNYRDYCAKVDELKQNGLSEYEIESFNPRTYESEQKARITNRLLELDYNKSSRFAQEHMTIAINHFQKKGYIPIKIELGAGGEDSLACEAVFAIPGCQGIVVQVVTDEKGIHKKLLGIQRTNGQSTSTARVLEVSRRLDNDGDGFNDASILYQDGFMVSSAIDSNTQNAEKYIESNGVYRLDEKEETVYDEIHSKATLEAKEKWATRLAKTDCRTATVSICNQEREERKQQIVAQKMAKRK